MQNENLYEIEEIREILLNADYAVFLSGAGISTDSGIPDFRGNGGLYETEEESNEYCLSRECLICEPERFFGFFRNHMLFDHAEPNDAHLALADLEERGIIHAVITQNIDGLHQKAGSRRVIELHGAADRCYCTGCGKIFGSGILSEQSGVPRCTACGSSVRPDVVLYGESLDGDVFFDAEEEIARADVLIVGGSSLSVNSAASLIDSFAGEHLIIINYSPTPYDGLAEYVIRDSLSDVLSVLAQD